MTKEQIYREQMQALGIYQEIFEPEIKTLARIEREMTRAEKAWSATAPPGGKPSFLDDHYAVIQKLRAEVLQHRQALGLTPQALRKLTGVNAGADAPVQQDLITAKLDRIAESIGDYDVPGLNDEIRITQDVYETLPDAQEASRISQQMDEELRKAVAEDMG